jgi:hypothetical protein
MVLDPVTLRTKAAFEATRHGGPAPALMGPVDPATVQAISDAWFRANPEFLQTTTNLDNFMNCFLLAIERGTHGLSFGDFTAIYQFLLGHGFIQTEGNGMQAKHYPSPAERQQQEEAAAQAALDKRQAEDAANKSKDFRQLQREARTQGNAKRAAEWTW